MKEGIRPSIALGFAGLLLVSCQAGTDAQRETLSIEEAKQVTASFDEKGSTPPPRQVTDILQILDQVPTANAERLASLRAEAAENPPADADAQTLARFYYDRSLSARQLGLIQQYLEDAEAAYGYAVETYGGRAFFADDRDFLTNAAFAQANYGDRNRFLELVETWRRTATAAHDRIFPLAWLASMNAWSGDIVSAEKYLAAFESAYAQDPKPTPWSRYFWEDVHSSYLASIGRYDEAESHYRKQLALVDTLRNDRDLAILSWADLVVST